MFSWLGGKASGGKGPAALPELVLLLEEPLPFTAEFLQGAVVAAFGRVLPTDQPDATEFVTGEYPVFFVRLKGRLLQVKSMPMLYDDPAVREFVSGDPGALFRTIRDPGLREAVARHQGWIAVTFMNPDDLPPGKDPYRYVSKMLAAFAWDAVAALVWPAEGRVIAWDFAMQDVLARGKGLTLFA